MALNRSDKSRILRRYFPGMTRNSEMSTEPSEQGNLRQAVDVKQRSKKLKRLLCKEQGNDDSPAAD